MEIEAIVKGLTWFAYHLTLIIVGVGIGWRMGELWYDRKHPDGGGTGPF